jgi:hypothetical protein
MQRFSMSVRTSGFARMIHTAPRLRTPFPAVAHSLPDLLARRAANVTRVTIARGLTFLHKGKQYLTCDVVNAQKPEVPAQ